ncbi:LysR family transcriptional regulator [Amycolatopsis rubida]|uniref:DNA-binding transcriptional regulator, LysR family n=1 Tax=Amycolatopsis rubida TaxID=112413 RepID=A0A1I5E7U5_9PSEU|nr:LysR family transcriptional regulator [Amycolatopsis rubida]SFO07678.1 DNA-binding transcriptional regulator, LysR family [Amycolatopsis rubida]
MSAPSPFRSPSFNVLSRLLRSSPALLDTTFDQLRTLITVAETGTALAAARTLGRDQSSVQKQLDTLNRNFSELCGEPLLHRQGRGRDVLFTDTGRAVAQQARRTLTELLDTIHECRRELGGTLTVGATRYTLGSLAHAGDLVAEQFRGRDIELNVVHVRTKDLIDRLLAKDVDLVCGSVVTTSALDSVDVLEWRRSGLGIVTNMDTPKPGEPVATSQLPTLPLVVPSGGVINDFMRGWFGSDYRNRLDIVAEIDSAQYGFELLRSGLVRGCMLVTQGLGEAAGENRLHAASGLRTIGLVDDIEPKLELLVGVFARRGERSSYPDSHPLNLLWNALRQAGEASWLEVGR